MRAMLTRIGNMRSDFRKFGCFILVGIANAAFGYAAFAAIYLLTDAYRIAVVLSTLIGVIFNFFTTGRMVFQNKRAATLIPFAFGYGVVCVLNIVALDLLSVFGVGGLFGQFMCLPFLALLSYIINDQFVFGQHL